MRARADRGAALLLVILLVALLSVLVVEFQREARVEVKSAQNLADDLQCHALLRSGISLADAFLAIYSNPEGFSAIESARLTDTRADFAWRLLQGEVMDLPVVSAALPAGAGLRAQFEDLYGRFPLGPLVADQPDPIRAVFRDYLGAVKDLLGEKEEDPLGGTDTDALADAIIERLEAAGEPGALRRLADLASVEGMTPAVLRALSPFLDTRAEWKFNVNSCCIPLLVTMHQGLSVDEARKMAGELREDPILADSDIPNKFGTVRPEFTTASLTTKSARFQTTLEASVRGGVRRARAVFGRKVDAAGVPEGRFRVEEWVEGWVEGLGDEATTAAKAPAEEGTPEGEESQ